MASAASIVRRAPSLCSTAPAGSPAAVTPTSSAIITTVMRAGEWVVTSTNHGSASHVIWVPVVEMISAKSNRAERPVAQDVGAAHAGTSIVSSRSPGVGEASRNSTPSSEPPTLIHIVVRRPIQPPSRPPSSAPMGRTP